MVHVHTAALNTRVSCSNFRALILSLTWYPSGIWVQQTVCRGLGCSPVSTHCVFSDQRQPWQHPVTLQSTLWSESSISEYILLGSDTPAPVCSAHWLNVLNLEVDMKAKRARQSPGDVRKRGLGKEVFTAHGPCLFFEGWEGAWAVQRGTWPVHQTR